MRLGKWLMIALMLALPASGQTDLTETQLREGLSKLSALLAADVPKNARWVLVTNSQGRFGIFSREPDAFATEGNTFLFDEKPGVEARIMVLQSGQIHPMKAEKDDRGGDDQEMPGEFRATWKNADAAKDAAAAAEWLKKEAKNVGAIQSNPDDTDPFGERDENNPAVRFAASQQTALLWAAMLFHTGQDAPALVLAGAALAGTDAPRRKQLLDSFFDRLGTQCYGNAMRDFATHRDWAKLRDALDALIKRFPHGWRQRDAVRVFLHHVTARAKLPAVPPLKTSPPLSAEDQKTALAWLKELEDGKQPPYDIWTLPPLNDEEGGGFQTRRNQMEAAFPRSAGLAAVPLLAALLADDTLTLPGMHEDDGYHYNYGGNGRDEAERLRQSYSNLQKPPTRASRAWNTLQRVLPQELRDADQDNLAEIIPDVLAWHSGVKNAVPADLALSYLETGQRDDTVLAHAVSTDDPKKLARIEGAMLDNVSIWELNTLEHFITKLGPQRGPAFLSKVRQKLEGEIARYDAGDQQRQRKQMDTALNRLEAAAKGEKNTLDLPAILAIAARYDPNAEEADRMEVQDAFQQLSKLLQKLPAAQRIESIVKALPGFKSSPFAAQMLEYAFDGGGEKIPELKPEEHQAVLDTTKPFWQKILDLEPTDENLRLQAEAVWRLQELAKLNNDFPLRQLLQLGERGTRIIRERGLAIVAGQQPAALPNPKDIDKAQREKLVAEWGAKSPADISAGLETLELDKILALNEEIARITLQRVQELPPGLKTHINTIQEVKAKDTDAASWLAWKGKPFDKETVIALARKISATKTTGLLTVSLYRNAPLFGLTLQVAESKTISGWQSRYLGNMDLASEFDGKPPPELQRFSMAICRLERNQEEWGWFDTPTFDAAKTGAEPKNEAAEVLAEMNEEAHESWQKVSSAIDKNPSAPVNIHLFTVPVSLLKKEE